MSTQQPSQKDYRVTLEAFEGPLDLLLFLVRRAEVDLQDIPIAEITDQYLDVLHQTRGVDVDIEQAGEFLVMAATLVEIKSCSLSPPERASEDDAGEFDASGDPRDELIRQLLSYQRIRAAGDALETRKVDFARRFPTTVGFDRGAFPAVRDGLELEDVHLMDLADAYEHIASAIDFAQLGDHVIELDDTPIALYEQDLIDQLGRRTGRSLTLQNAFAGRQPLQRVGMFLAVLELVRRFQVRFEQDGDGPVELVLRPEEEWDDPSDVDDQDPSSD